MIARWMRHSVTRLWYLRQVDPRTELYTGLRATARPIENGKITSAVKKSPFPNESPLFL